MLEGMPESPRGRLGGSRHHNEGFDDNPTILEECQLCMHVDHEENILCDSYIVEFDYDPTCNYYERGNYG